MVAEAEAIQWLKSSWKSVSMQTMPCYCLHSEACLLTGKNVNGHNETKDSSASIVTACRIVA